MSWNNTKTPLKPDGPHKWQIQKDDYGFVLTALDEDRLRKHYPTEMNPTLMKWFGISSATLHRFARKLGLKKDMTIIRKKHTRMVKQICEKNGYYDSIRGKAPSQQAIEATKRKRAEGFCPIREYKRRHPMMYKKMVKTAMVKLHALKIRDRRRLDLGLEPLVFSSMALVPYTKRQVQLRTYAKKIGYIAGSKLEVSGQRHHIFYTSVTVRHPLFEKRCEQAGLYIDRIPQNIKCIVK